MFGIFNSLGGGEVVAILVLALIVLGPEKLPEAIRKFGNIYGELRRMSQGFQSELKEAFDEPLRELRGTAQAVQDAVQKPLSAVSGSLEEAATAPSPAPVEETQAPVEDPGAAPRPAEGPDEAELAEADDDPDDPDDPDG